jgi:hypothetical protein
LETELNLDPDSNPDPELMTDPDPNLQIISDPAGSGCTTLLNLKYTSCLALLNKREDLERDRNVGKPWR